MTNIIPSTLFLFFMLAYPTHAQDKISRSDEEPSRASQAEKAVNYYCGTVPDKVVTKTPKPVKLAYPTPPSRAKTSGHCKVKFNVNYKGKVTHPETTFCTDTVFRKSSIKTIKRWKYAPSDNSQGEYQYCGLVIKIRYGVFELKDGKLQ